MIFFTQSLFAEYENRSEALGEMIEQDSEGQALSEMITHMLSNEEKLVENQQLVLTCRMMTEDEKAEFQLVQANNTEATCDLASYDQRNRALYWQQQGAAIVMFCGFTSLRMVTGDENIPSLVNALTTGTTGTYLYASQNNTMTSIVSSQPSYEYTPENTIPLMLYAYGGYEMLSSIVKLDKPFSIKVNKPFVAHGFMLLAGSAASHYVGKLRIAIFGILPELSQIFFNAGYIHKRLYREKGVPPSPYFFVPFLGTFIATRWVMFPYEHYKFIRDTCLVPENFWKEPVMNSMIAVGGFVIDGLNIFWSYKIGEFILKQKK